MPVYRTLSGSNFLACNKLWHLATTTVATSDPAPSSALRLRPSNCAVQGDTRFTGPLSPAPVTRTACRLPLGRLPVHIPSQPCKPLGQQPPPVSCYSPPLGVDPRQTHGSHQHGRPMGPTKQVVPPCSETPAQQNDQGPLNITQAMMCRNHLSENAMTHSDVNVAFRSLATCCKC